MVHGDAGGEGIVRIDDQLREIEPGAGLIVGPGQDCGEDPGLHFGAFCVPDSSFEDVGIALLGTLSEDHDLRGPGGFFYLGELAIRLVQSIQVCLVINVIDEILGEETLFQRLVELALSLCCFFKG